MGSNFQYCKQTVQLFILIQRLSMTKIKDVPENNWHENKEYRLKCLESLFQKTNLFYIVSTCLWIIYLINSKATSGLGKDLTDLLYTHWVKPIFAKIETGSIPLWFIIGLTFLIGLYFMGKALRQYIYSGKSILFYFFLILNYSFLRFTSNVWEIANIAKEGFFSYFAYWDLIFILLIPICFRFIKWCISFIKIRNFIVRGQVLVIPAWNKIKRTFKKPNQKSNQKTTKTELILEREITDKTDDILNRADIAKQIASILHPIKPDKAFAVGITAPWGYGKTSFLNFLNIELKEKDDKAIFIKFSPWYCKSEADIISLFFDSLSDELKPYHSSINNQIDKYAKLLLSAHKNQVSGAINKTFDLFSKPKDVRSIYEQIDTSIGDLNRKIYITIDDLDRLYPKEIIECFKIIRNTANFKNIVFIVAYDLKYVENALKKGLKNNHKGYIDKIIQLPFNLPRIEDYKLLNYIVEELKKKGIESNTVLKQKYYKNSEKDIISANKNHVFDISKYFTNIRDCNKILNIFFTYRKLLGDEVLDSELFLVCMLRTLYPAEALIIHEDLGNYFTFGNRVLFKDTIDSITHWAASKKNPPEKIEPIYLIDQLNKNEDFLDLVQAIFLRPKPNIRSAAMHNNYKSYYNGLVSEEKIKYAEFEKWIVSAETLIKQIEHFKKEENAGTNNEKLDNLNEKLSDFTPQNKKQAQIILHGLFYLDRNLNAVIPMLFDYQDDSIEILNQILDHKLEIPLQGIARKLADIKLGIIDSNADSDYKRAFNLVKIQVLSIKALIKKITTGIIDTDSDYKDILDIYWNCFIERTEGPMKIDPIANKLMKYFAKKHAVSFIKNLETTVNHPSSKLTRRFHYSIDQIFSDKIEDYEPFDTFLKETVEKNPDDVGLKQIDEYWDEFKKKEYKSYELKEQEIAEKKHEAEVTI